MKKIIIFSGTTEGRKLSELMAAAGIAHTVSVATDYGKLVMKAHPKVKIQGRTPFQRSYVRISKERIL